MSGPIVTCDMSFVSDKFCGAELIPGSNNLILGTNVLQNLIIWPSNESQEHDQS